MILVVAEQRNGHLNRATWEALAAAQLLAGGDGLTVAVFGAPGTAPKDLAGAASVSTVLVVDHPALAAYTPDGYALALAAVVASASPQYVLLPHTYQTRDFAPLVAARLRRPIVTDVTGISGKGAEATFTRPMFQGKLAADVRPIGEHPWFVTCQVGAFRGDAVKTGGAATVTPFTVELDPAAIRQQPEVPFQEAKQAVDLSQAERIVAVGRGIKSEDNLQVARRLATALGAEIAASRPICDSGWMPMDRQVGSSGQTVAPKLYVALGVSGAIQHLVGMKGSRTIVAVNKDADAPIFEVADYGIVGDLFEIVPAIVAELEEVVASVDRETLDVDVLIVGGGPAGLSAALRLAQLQKHKGGAPLSIAVIEKAREAGAHELSGAVLDPSTLAELIPDYRARGAPFAADVGTEHVYFLTPGGKVRFPIVPPPLRNHGHAIISLNRFVEWLARQVESDGIDIFTGFSGRDVLTEGNRVVGVRTGDRGRGRDGREKAAFEAGVDIRAQVTIFCDGVRGNLTKELVQRLGLAEGRQPQQYALGIKELWEVPADRVASGTVIHTMGYPLRQSEFGGGFVYAMPDGQLSVGFVAGLDYADPGFDPHVAFNLFKTHPFVRGLLHGGKMVRYGAKALPEGGWNTIPRVFCDGALIAGDAGAFLNSVRLKGIHLAMRTGMLAAEAAFDAVRAGNVSAAAQLERYQHAIDASAVREELYPVRNVHQAFGHGLFAGLVFAGLSLVTGGRWLGDLRARPGHARMMRLGASGGADAAHEQSRHGVDRVLTFDKVTNVHYSGTAHEDDQPPHLLVHTEVCGSICGPECGHPCTRFCPANVYDIVRERDGGPRLQINASNCVHCKTCDIMDPYQVITWVRRRAVGAAIQRDVTTTNWHSSWRKRAEIAAIAGIGYPIIAALGHTLRWRVEGLQHLDAIVASRRQPVMAFWHGRILPATFYFRRRGIVVITSENFDGEWIARIIERFGYGTARGSTSRGARKAMLRLVREMAAGKPAGFTLDGPRGPARVAQPGAVWLAGATGNPLLPFHLEASSHWTMPSWDRTQIPKPFSTVALVVGAPVEVARELPDDALDAVRQDLEQRLTALETRALALLGP